MLTTVAEYIRTEAVACSAAFGLPGYLAGVYHGGDQIVVAHGVANIETGIPMTEDTSFLIGSVTKVLTTTLLLQHVERGLIDLDERVTSYLPELQLASPAGAGEIRVRNLLNHTDGIDGDIFLPDINGEGALKMYVQQLERCATLFEPGEYLSYSNPAFMIAGRLLEVVTGKRFHDLFERELYQRIGARDSCTSAAQAILRRTAVGHFGNPVTGAAQRTRMFMLPESWSACGSTPIMTTGDLLAFARTHLKNGVAPSGERVLSQELTQRMRTVTFDMRTPSVPPIGLGWWVVPLGETTGLWHAGASPGGSCYLLVIPEYDFAFAAFGNGPGAPHDKLALWLVREHLRVQVPEVVSAFVEASDLASYEGTYRSNQLRMDIRAVDGQLEQAITYEPLDADQERILTEGSGAQFPGPPLRFVPVGNGLFAPAGAPLESFTGIRGRGGLMSFHGQAQGRAAYRGWAGRLARRIT